jgi:hypothetical protein
MKSPQQLALAKLHEIVASYSARNQIKELCISLEESGELKLGARTMLISEIKENQEYKYLAGTIQVIFACSSNSMCAERVTAHTLLTDQLREMMVDNENGESVCEFIYKIDVNKFVSFAPCLEKITFKNKYASNT